MITLDCVGKNKKHFKVFSKPAPTNYSLNTKQNSQIITEQLSTSLHLTYLEKYLVLDRLYIVYDYRGFFSNEYMFEQIQKLIIDEFSHCIDCYFISRDPATCNDDNILNGLKEFKFYNLLSKWQKPKKFIHPQLIESEYQLYYGDINVDYWIEKVKQKLYKPPKNNLLFEHKLSCLVNAARYPRSIFIILIYDLDIILSHRDKLGNVTRKLSSTLDESVCSKIRENYKIAKNKLRANKLWNSLKTYTPAATEQSLNMIQKSFCNIVIEDPVHSKFTRITEKICKPIVSYRPFLLLAAPNTLAWLKNNGFRTFDKWWDESYDQEPNHLLRIQAVYRVAQYINSLSKKECQKILDEMQPILEHNQQHLFEFQNILHKEIIS